MSPEQRLSIAKRVSEVLGPVPMGVVLAVAVGIHSGRGVLAGAGWGLISVTCAAVLPAVSTAPLRRRQPRTQAIRLRYLGLAIAGALVGLAILWFLPALSDIRVLAAGFVAGLICSAAVNVLYPCSNHVAALAGGVLLAASLLCTWMVALWAAVPLLAWSRVTLRAHTWPQTMAGATTGSVSAIVIVLLAGAR